MAEATLAPEVEQPNAEAVTTPEVTPDSAQQTNQEASEETNELDALFSTFADGAEDGATDATPTSTDGTPADPYAGLTPAEIREKVRQEEADKAKTAATSAQTQAYLNGLARVVQENPQRIIDLAERLNIVGEDRKSLTDAFSQLHGAYSQLYQHSAQQANEVAGTNFATAYRQGAEQVLGKEGADAAYKDNPSWEVFFGRVGEQYAKKMGLATKKELSEAVTAGQKKVIGKFAEALKAHGLDIKQFTGEANPSVPPMRGGGGLNTVQALDKAYGDGKIDATTYKANYKRLTGREP